MIEFRKSEFIESESEFKDAIFFDEEDLPKLIKVLERGLNTISPPEPYLDLIKLLEDMKNG